MYSDGVPFTEFLQEGNCLEFVDRYLMRAMRRERGRVIYEPYAVIGGELAFIQG